MIFNKAYLAEQLDEKVKNNFEEMVPFETHYEKVGDRHPLQIIMKNFFTTFDLNSNEMKDLHYKARKEIVESCFKEEDLSVIPNSSNIKECINRINYKHYGSIFDRRNAYFGNSIVLFLS